MKMKKIGILVLAAAVLAVMTGGMASALTPWAVINSESTTGAGWVYNSPINHFTAAKGGYFSEKCYWEQETPTRSYNIDGIYSYNSIYTYYQSNQVNYPGLLSGQGQIREATTSVRASTYNTGTDKDYTIALGFWINSDPLINSFTSSVTEKLTVTP